MAGFPHLHPDYSFATAGFNMVTGSRPDILCEWLTHQVICCALQRQSACETGKKKLDSANLASAGLPTPYAPIAQLVEQLICNQ